MGNSRVLLTKAGEPSKFQTFYSACCPFSAQVVELVDTPDLGSGAVRYVGSSPILGTFAETFSEMAMSPHFSN